MAPKEEFRLCFSSRAQAVNPVEMALVTWKATKEIVFEGGPGPWVLEPSRFFSELIVERQGKIEVVQIRLPTQRKVKQYVYRAECLELGEQVRNFHLCVLSFIRSCSVGRFARVVSHFPVRELTAWDLLTKNFTLLTLVGLLVPV